MGSIFLSMLLLPGLCFSIGGIKYREQSFGGVVTIMLFPMIASILTLTAPTALYWVTAEGFQKPYAVQSFSLACAVILLLLCAAFLLFQLKTHVDLFDEDGVTEGEFSTMEEEDSEHMASSIGVRTAVSALPIMLILITLCAQTLIVNLPSVVEGSGLSRTFIGFVLLPFISSTSELFTAVIVTYKGKADLALGVCTGTIIQTVLFVMPVLVIASAILNHPLDLQFSGSETLAVFFAVVYLAVFLQKGTSTYFDGLLCLGFYSIVVIAFLFFPDERPD